MNNLPFIDNRMELSTEEKRLILFIRQTKKDIVKYGSDIKEGLNTCKKIVTQIVYVTEKNKTHE